jgi:hypothetical protein
LLVEYGAPPIHDPKSQKAAVVQSKKMPPPQKQKINERRIPKTYILTVFKDGYYQPMTQEEYQNFLHDNPDVAPYFTETPDENNTALDSLPVPDVPEIAQIYDCWDKAAKRLLNSLWKHNHAWIFYEPVDYVKLSIPDYLDIIKTPMDLGTVKANLHSNKYGRMQDFLSDVQLIFDNCILYNGENSQVSIMCKHVREEYNKLYENLYIDFYL